MTADTSADSGIPLSAICNFWSGTNIILFLVVIRSHSVVVATRGNNSQSSIGNGSAYQNRIYADFSLESRRDGLDRAALEVAQFQEASLAKRKALAHSTKTFRASASPDVSKAVAALLKEYQLEVDRLTTRAKHGESAFLDVYQKLYEAPDPASALLVAVEHAAQLTSLEAQNRKLANELADYEAEAKAIRNQDLTLRKLEDRVKELEAELQSKDREVVRAREEGAAEVDEAAVREMQEREQRLAQMLGEAQASLGTMQRLHRGAQDKLFELQSASEDTAASSTQELDISAQELERASQRVLLLENEKRLLLSRLDSSSTAAGATQDAQDAGALQKSLAAAREELSAQKRTAQALQQELLRVRTQTEDEASTLQSRYAAMKQALEAQEAHCAALEAERAVLPSVATVDALRKQVQSLQMLHFGSVDEGPGGSGGDGAASLDTTLVAKVRGLEHELTMQRLKLYEANAAAEAAEGRVAELEHMAKKQQMQRLRLNEANAAAEAAEGRVAELERMAEEQQATISRLEEDLVAAEHASTSGPTRDAADAGTDVRGDDHSMLQVLCAQRDRFRARAQQLQEDLARCEASLGSSSADAAAARADNVALVERLRYVQSYSQKNAARNAADLEAGVAAEGKYSKEYERGLDPFSEFKGKQRDSSKLKMNAADKAVHILGQLVVGHKWARLALVGYLILLHILVFGVLTRVAHAHEHAVTYSAVRQPPVV